MEWTNFLTAIAVILFLCVTCLLVRETLNFLRSHAFFQPWDMLKPKCNRIVFFISSFWSLYRQSRPESPFAVLVCTGKSRPECPLLCLIMQGIYGGSIVEAKQRIGVITLGLKPAVIFGKAETVEVVLSSTTLIEKAQNINSCTHGWALDSSQGWQLKHFSPAAKWRHRRKLLTPTFHFTILEDFIPVFQEQSSVLVSKLQDLTQEPWVDIVPLVTSCTLDIICRTSDGVGGAPVHHTGKGDSLGYFLP
ncbi:cytochrome P450 4c3 [Caerostris extrusa]|uniref:Cytochrome P450 4c3 n=1 Tax=Caerostris extrusa TaxID=172846 RepID=A0AAV4X3Z5_CAEEX|nr:cytochrome P450 4c3 [Caerostris extrusa]